MKSRPGQGLTVISKKIRLKQNDQARRRTQCSPHTRRDQHSKNPPPAQSPPYPIACRSVCLNWLSVFLSSKCPSAKGLNRPPSTLSSASFIDATDKSSTTGPNSPVRQNHPIN